MKKLALLFVVLLFAACTPTQLEDENPQQIDKDKICPPNDRNCNGIPDNEE